MNLSIENYQKRILNPVWSSNHIRDASTTSNVWPIRPQSHPRRFYSTPKSRRSYVNITQFSPQITPITMRVDIDHYNKQKSQSHMAFCSTSKVKYMPLQGISSGDSSPMKWASASPSLFPTLSRPNSRPVILHGQRYTVMTVEDERSSMGLSSTTKEEDKLSPKIEYVSEQRRRFNMAEKQKSNSRIFRDNADMSEYRIGRNYCLSGQKMFFKNLRQSADERFNRVRPTMNEENVIEKIEEPLDHDVKVDDGEEDLCRSISVTLDSEKDKIAVEEEDINGCVITVDIAQSTKDSTMGSNGHILVNTVVRSTVEELDHVKSNPDLIDHAKDLLIEMIQKTHSELLQNDDGGSMSEVWASIQPTVFDMEDDPDSVALYEIKLGLDSSEKVDPDTFLMRMFGEDNADVTESAWSKIFSILQVRSVEKSMFIKIIKFLGLFQTEEPHPDLYSHPSVGKMYFWSQLFVTLLGADCDWSRYLKMLTTVIVNRNIADEESITFVKDCLEAFMTGRIDTEAEHPSQTSVMPLSSLVDDIQWVFKVHNDIFHRLLTMDDIATVLAANNHQIAM